MKKLLTILSCAAVICALTACKDNGSAAVRPAASSVSKGTPYKEPVNTSRGTDAANGTSSPSTGVSSRFNYISTSDVEKDYEVEEDLGGVNILRYRGEGGKVTVPSVIGGKAVIKIDQHAFRGSEVTNVVIPSSVRVIGTHAFSGCGKLESLTVYEGVEEINDYAFADCPKLALVSLPDSIREIGSGSFRNCPSLMLTYKGKTYTVTNVEDLYLIF